MLLPRPIEPFPATPPELPRSLSALGAGSTVPGSGYREGDLQRGSGHGGDPETGQVGHERGWVYGCVDLLNGDPSCLWRTRERISPQAAKTPSHVARVAQRP